VLPARGLVQLPNTCPQNRRCYAHIRLLTQVRAGAWNAAGFEGKLYRPGARVSAGELGDNPILLECAGPQGNPHHGRPRLTLWILWRWEGEWREIARALSPDWSWALILREPAIRALRPATAENAGVDPHQRGRELTDELLRDIDTALLPELPEVRTLVWTSIYDQMAGRIVA